MPAVTFVINGTLAKASGRFLGLCRTAAARSGWEPEFVITDKAEAGVAAARDAATGGADLVVAAGGDGTVRACAEALAGTDVPLGIVPLGTGNLLARTLGIPGNPKLALAVALGVRGGAAASHAAGRPGGVATGSGQHGSGQHGSGQQGMATADRRIDLATADGALFTAMAGMGLDASVVAATRLKHRLGWLAYAMSGAAHLALPPARFSIRIDDGAPVEREARSVVVGNSGLLPGGFTLLPDARIDDGLLDIGILAPHGLLGWPRVATRVLTHSQHQDRQLEWRAGRKIEITAHTALPREMDGEVITAGRTLSVAVWPAALIVRVPA